MLVKKTNRYATQIIESKINQIKKTVNDWFPVTYIAFCIIKLQVKKLTIQMYWSKREIIHTSIFA